MDEAGLRALLEAVRRTDLDVGSAVEQLRDLPYQKVGDFARIDRHRGLRNGLPEVVFCQGKTTEQAVAIIDRLAVDGSTVLATRAPQELLDAVSARHPEARLDPLGRTVLIPAREAPLPRPGVLVLTAGTADLPVAREALTTAEAMGSSGELICDVGVAGLHRLLDQREAMRRARVIVVAAGMDGALPSVVGGLVSVPVIAVPTSVGYGASFGGIAALLTMLNSCAPGIAVVNIDNGFAAGYMAGLINRSSQDAA
jgi:pyridinium-3,5-biscarboxylic acid mononucleotide synthase